MYIVWNSFSCVLDLKTIRHWPRATAAPWLLERHANYYVTNRSPHMRRCFFIFHIRIYGTEALRLCLDFAFTRMRITPKAKLNLEKLHIDVTIPYFKAILGYIRTNRFRSAFNLINFWVYLHPFYFDLKMFSRSLAHFPQILLPVIILFCRFCITMIFF